MEERPALFATHRELIGERVRVELADGTFTRGLLLAIDPETDHVALADCATESAGDVRVRILLGHHIRGLTTGDEEESEEDSLDDLVQTVSGGPGASSAIRAEGSDTARLERLTKFLDQHFVTSRVVLSNGSGNQVSSVELFGGAAALLPPFDAVERSVVCDNEQLLARLEPLFAKFLDLERQASTADDSAADSS